MSKYLAPNIPKWREIYNPLVGLTFESLRTLRVQGRQGSFANLQAFYQTMLETNQTLLALRVRRESALLRLDWGVKTVSELPPGATEAQAQAQTEALRQVYNNIDNLRDAISFLALAEFVGYSHLQMHRGDDGQINHLEPLPQWCWVRDGSYGQWYWNPTAEPFDARTLIGHGVKPIEETDFIIRFLEGPCILLNSSANFVRENLALKDWTSFIEIYGIPAAFIIGPPGVTSEKEKEYQDSAERVSAGGGGYLPNGSDVKFATDPKANIPFKEFLAHLQEGYVIAATGGKLSMLTGATGLGSSTGQAHQDAFNEIAEAEGSKISELFQKSIDKPFLARAFPGQPPLAYFELATQEEPDTEKLSSIVLKLSQAGFDVDPGQVEEAVGFKVAKKEPIPMPPSAPTKPGDKKPQPDDDGQDPDDQALSNRINGVGVLLNSGTEAQTTLVNNVLEDLTGVQNAWLAPVKPFIQDLIAKAESGEVSDADLIATLKRASEQMPELFDKLNTAALSTALEKAMGASVVNGAAQKRYEFSRTQS